MSAPQRAGWVEQGTASADLATATKALAAGKQHMISGITAGFAGVNTGILCVIKDGTTVIWTCHVHNDFSHVFDPPIPGTKGVAMSAELSAGSAAAAVCINGDTF